MGGGQPPEPLHALELCPSHLTRLPQPATRQPPALALTPESRGAPLGSLRKAPPIMHCSGCYGEVRPPCPPPHQTARTRTPTDTYTCIHAYMYVLGFAHAGACMYMYTYPRAHAYAHGPGWPRATLNTQGCVWGQRVGPVTGSDPKAGGLSLLEGDPARGLRESERENTNVSHCSCPQSCACLLAHPHVPQRPEF